MSILSSFYHGTIRDNPNAVHNLRPGERPDPAALEAASAAMGPQPAALPGDDPEVQRREEDIRRRQRALDAHPHRMSPGRAQQAARNLNCVSASRAAWQAALSGALRPGLYYSQQQAAPGPSGWEESPRTVADKLEEREETPRG